MSEVDSAELARIRERQTEINEQIEESRAQLAENARQLQQLRELQPSAPPQAASTGAGSSQQNSGNVFHMVMGPPTKGERALWIVAILGTAQAVATFFLVVGFLVVWIDAKDRGHQMNALYQSVPGLRELVNKAMESNREIENREREKP